MKKGNFYQNERLFVMEKADFLRNVSHPKGKMIQLLTFMIIQIKANRIEVSEIAKMAIFYHFELKTFSRQQNSCR